MNVVGLLQGAMLIDFTAGPTDAAEGVKHGQMQLIIAMGIPSDFEQIILQFSEPLILDGRNMFEPKRMAELRATS